MRLLWIIAAAALCVLASACDGGDGGGDETQVPPTPTAVPFDLNSLTATVLNKNDVGEGFEVSGQFSPGDPTAGAQTFTSVLASSTLRIQSTVARYADAAAASQDFQRNRQILPTFGASEENFDVAGAEIAFLYRLRTTTGTATWAIVDNYVVYLQMSPTEQGRNPDPASTDVDRLHTYTETVVGRVNQLINDPSSVTPVPIEEFNSAAPVPTTSGATSTP
jgi:hypothetical protein